MRKIYFLLLLITMNVAKAQSNYYITSTDSTKLFVQEYGKGDPVIILAGGPGLNAIYLEALYQKLSGKYRCIVLDQRGTGKSHIATVDSITMDMKNYMNDLEALRKYLKLEKVTLIGHSWGGMLIMEYAARHPLQIEKLILLDPGGPTNSFFVYFPDNINMRLRDEDLKEMARLDSLKQSHLSAILPGYFFDRKKALAMQASIRGEINGQKGVNPNTLRSYVATQNERVTLLKNYKGPV